MSDWTEKHRPESIELINGNNTARRELEDWAKTWENHRSAAIVYGPPGIGKTTAAHALSNDMGWDTMEMNASDKRTGDLVERLAGEASKTGTLTQTAGNQGRRLVIIDEADNFHGNKDRGGSRAITEVVKEAEQPIVLVANNFYDMSKSLRNSCKNIEFEDVGEGQIVATLARIANAEGLDYEREALELLAEQSQGDVRSAVNDLQAVAATTGNITEEDVVTGSRDKEEGLFEFLDLLLKTGSMNEARQMSRDVDETPDDLIMWIEHNITKEYNVSELTAGYGSLSEADKWLGRVRASQEYSYWKYAGDQIVAGVAAARDGQHGGWTRWQPPYSSYYGSSSDLDGAAEKIATEEGISINTAAHEVLPFLAVLIEYCKPRELAVKIAARYNLDESDLSAITGSGKTTNKVQGIIEDATKMRGQAREPEQETTREGEDTDESDSDVSESEIDIAPDDQEEDDDDSGEDDNDTTQQTGLGDFA